MNDFNNQFELLRESFLRELPQRLLSLRKLWSRINDDEVKNSDLKRLCHQLQSLLKAGANLGLLPSNVAPSQLDIWMRVSADPARISRQHLLETLNTAIVTLTASSRRWYSMDADMTPFFGGGHYASATTSVVFVIDDDPLTHRLLSRFENQGYLIECFNNFAEFEASSKSVAPDVVIINADLLSEGDDQALFAFCRGRESVCPPMIFISEHSDIDSHLKAVRLGAHRYMIKPLNINKLKEVLDGFASQVEVAPYRVLIIDDDNVSAQRHALYLAEEGMEVRTLSEPLEVLDVMHSFRPELVVLDLYMSGCSGQELAAVIRQEEQYAQVPLVFLSSEVDVDKQMAVMAQGGGDFLTKPVVPEHLQMTVKVRLQRKRWIDRLNKELRASLRESEYQRIAMDQHAIVSIADVCGNITFVNDKFCEVSGYSQDELLGQNHRIIKSGQHPPAFYQAMWSCIVSGKVWQGDVCNRAKDGSYYWVESTIIPFLDELGRPYQYVSIRTDISHLKKAEESLKKYKRAMDCAIDGLGILNPQGEYLYLNPELLVIHGYQKTEELLGRHWSKLFGEQAYRFLAEEAIPEVEKHGRWHGEVTGQKKSGECLPLSLSISTLEGGGMVYVVRDISDLKQTQQALITARDVAEQASLAKSSFISSMSHELRTPLNAILGYAQLFEYDKGLSDRQKKGAQEIYKAGQHLLALVNEVLDLSKIEAGCLELNIAPVSISAVYAECRALLGPLMKARGIRVEVHDCDLYVVADYVRMKQVLLNLLSNAVKYNRPKGRVDVRCSRVGEQIKISLQDTGLGIEADKLGQLFEPFNRLGAEKGDIEGAGIGLMLTKHLVEMMSGQIGVESTPGEGSTFWITLPYSEKSGPAVPLANDDPLLAEGKDGKAYTLIYVEDNPANLRLMQRIVSQRKSWQLLHASSAEMGLELIQVEQPSLILMDINLSGMDGYQALRQIQSDPTTRGIPVIAISANAMQKDIEQGLNAGFEAYMTKPINIKSFLETVDRILEGG